MRTLILAVAAVATQAIHLKQLEGTFTCGPDGTDPCGSGGTAGGTMASIAGGEGESWGPMLADMTSREGSGPWVDPAAGDAGLTTDHKSAAIKKMVKACWWNC